MTTVDAELDLAQLRALLAVAGALKVITGAHACGAGTHPDPCLLYTSDAADE